MTETLNLTNIVSEKVKQLCARNPDYENLLRTIIRVDRRFENNQFGWEYNHVEGLSGGALNTLMQAGIIRSSYKSNNYSHYRLQVNSDDMECILDDIELARLEAETGLDGAAKKTTPAILDPAMVQRFEELVASGQDMLEYWALRLNPKIVGMQKEREACLIALASPPDKNGLMRRCHVLIWGPPGTGKSQIITYIKHHLDAVGVSPSSSEVGLKFDARGQGTAGALIRAHNKTLVIEEVDKMDRETIEALYESMSTGEFDINKGDFHETFQAEIRAIGVANEIKKLPAPFLDRFDMTFYYEIPGKDEEKRITNELYMQWLKSQDDFKGVGLRSYLEWIKPFEPEIKQYILENFMKLKDCYIDMSEKKPDVREKEAFLKVAYVIAKINRRELMIEDFLRAIQLVDSSFTGSKYEALKILAKEFSKPKSLKPIP